MSIIVNSRISFVFALMKCSYAAFGEQNKIDNDSKCELVYKSHLLWVANALSAFLQPTTKYIHELSIIVDFNCQELSLKVYP